jgi:hypothetical protein
MIDTDSAKQIAWKYVQQLQQPPEDRIVLMEEHTQEEDFGWVFFYNSKAFIETGEFRYMLGGNAPIIVSRESGAVHVTGTACRIEEYLANFVRFGDSHLKPGPSLVVSGWEIGANKILATRAIRTHTKLGLAISKSYVDTVLDGKSAEIACDSAESAAHLVSELTALGFNAKQNGI